GDRQGGEDLLVGCGEAQRLRQRLAGPDGAAEHQGVVAGQTVHLIYRMDVDLGPALPQDLADGFGHLGGRAGARVVGDQVVLTHGLSPSERAVGATAPLCAPAMPWRVVVSFPTSVGRR